MNVNTIIHFCKKLKSPLIYSILHKYGRDSRMLGRILYYLKYDPERVHDQEPSVYKILSESLFEYYGHANRGLSAEEFHKKYWRDFGVAYLQSMNQVEIGEYYMKEICGAIENKGVRAVLELGCGFLRHLDYLSKKYPYLKLYGIDITEGCEDKAKELGNKNITVFADDVRNLSKYSNILKTVDLIFSYGIFIFLDQPELESVCQIIEDNFKGIVVYSEAACALNIQNLQDSIEVKVRQYVHPYPKVFAAHNIEQIKFRYAENRDSFVLVGIQR